MVAFHDTWMPSIQAVLRFILANRPDEICSKFSSQETRLPLREWCKQIAARWLAKIPGANRLFNSSVLRPWSSFQIGNLAFFQKVSNDRRDWRFHQSF
jgi:hypothetical protein